MTTDFKATTDFRGATGYDDAITGAQQALYSPQLWRLLRAGLSELREGRGDTLLRLADTYSGRLEDGSYTNIDDAFNAVRCVDGPPTTDRGEADEADARFRAAAPYLDDGRSTGNAPLDLCAFWPVPNMFGSRPASPPSRRSTSTTIRSRTAWSARRAGRCCSV